MQSVWRRQNSITLEIWMRPDMNALKSELRRKDEFIAMLGHEPRNPLSVLTTAARIFKIDGATSTDTKRTADIISRQVPDPGEAVIVVEEDGAASRTAARGSRFSVRLPVQQPMASPCTRS
jgi:hypothetical protein